jgi:hypothetical protein
MTRLRRAITRSRRRRLLRRIRRRLVAFGFNPPVSDPSFYRRLLSAHRILRQSGLGPVELAAGLRELGPFDAYQLRAALEARRA